MPKIYPIKKVSAGEKTCDIILVNARPSVTKINYIKSQKITKIKQRCFCCLPYSRKVEIVEKHEDAEIINRFRYLRNINFDKIEIRHNPSDIYIFKYGVKVTARAIVCNKQCK